MVSRAACRGTCRGVRLPSWWRWWPWAPPDRPARASGGTRRSGCGPMWPARWSWRCRRRGRRSTPRSGHAHLPRPSSPCGPGRYIAGCRRCHGTECGGGRWSYCSGWPWVGSPGGAMPAWWAGMRIGFPVGDVQEQFAGPNRTGTAPIAAAWAAVTHCPRAWSIPAHAGSCDAPQSQSAPASWRPPTSLRSRRACW